MRSRRILAAAILATATTIVVAAKVVGAPAPMDDVAQTAARRPAAVTFDSSRAWEHLRRQVLFGPRPAGSAALNDTRRYILDQLKASGIETRQQVFIARTPLGETSMGNVIATIPGRRRERIIIETGIARGGGRWNSIYQRN
jgi:hypothetical protein